MKWKSATPSTGLVDEFTASLGLSRTQAVVIVNRGIGSVDEARAFLRPSLSTLPQPEVLPNMDAASERVVLALQRRERMAVWGDYDVDGISAAALLTEFLQACGAKDTLAVLPNRERDGYGLNEAGLGRLADAGVKLLITVDCGVCDVDEAAYLQGRGVDLVVTDHHEPCGRLPAACAVVDPKLQTADRDLRGLAGVGVSFFLAVAVKKRLERLGLMPDFDLRSLLDLVVLGTVADVVPLLGSNRALVSRGLADWGRFVRPGLASLCSLALNGKAKPDTEDLSFHVAPSINAAGRLGDPDLGLRLLLTRNPVEAVALARELVDLNNLRKKYEKELEAQAEQQLAEQGPPGPAVVLAGRDWHRGILGTVSSRFVKRLNRPVFVLSLDAAGRASGSGRSIHGYNILAGLSSCRELLSHFGGHDMAAGLELPAANLPEFSARMARHFLEAFGGVLPEQVLPIDMELAAAELEPGLCAELEALGPFGAGNVKPVFLSRGLRVAESTTFGRNGKRHLKAMVEAEGRRLEAVRYSCKDEPPSQGQVLDLVFSLSESSFGGRVRTVLLVEDWRASGTWTM